MFLFDTIRVFDSIIGVGIYLIVLILGVRHVNRLTYYKSVIFGFLCGFISILVFELLFILIALEISIDLLAVSVVNLITYSLFGLCYFAFINGSVSALRIRLLRELYDSNGGLTIDEILMLYNSKEIVDRRVQKLERKKQITCENERYYVIKSVTLGIVLTKEFLSFLLLGKKPRINFKCIVSKEK